MFSVILLCISVASWGIPLMHQSFTENIFLIDCSQCFSGGVFLMLAFGHLFSHSVEDFKNANSTDFEGFMWILFGYMMMFFLDKILFDAPLPNEINNNDNNDSNNSSILTLVIAMTVHNAFESMVLGLCTSKKNALVVTMSIGFHLPAESIALLGACLKTSWDSIFIAKILGCYSGVGLICAVAATYLSRYASPYIDAIVMAFTAGTFVYIATTEVVGESFENCRGQEKWIKFGCFILGMALIRGIAYVTILASGHEEINDDTKKSDKTTKKKL